MNEHSSQSIVEAEADQEVFTRPILPGKPLTFRIGEMEYEVPSTLESELVGTCAEHFRTPMQSPEHPSLPFFAYGLFKPGELGFDRLEDMVEDCKVGSVASGRLWIRDGLPLFDHTLQGNVYGTLIEFKGDMAENAYRQIASIEPEDQYAWKEVRVHHSSGVFDANVLSGRTPARGGKLHDDNLWCGEDDPLFNEALDVIRETISSAESRDTKDFFRLQMAYLLLWSAIERYASLRYHLGDNAMQKVMCIAGDTAFAEALMIRVGEERTVFRADDREKKETLRSDNARKSLRYYYQIRSNMTHRGKGENRDFVMLEKSLSELLVIFDHVKRNAFRPHPKWR